MEFEVLKKSHLKRNIIMGLVVVAVISVIVLNYTRAKYQTTESMPLINGTVNYDASDLNTVAVYLQDESASDGYAKADTIPTEGYTFNAEMSYCTVDGNKDDNILISYDMDTQMLTVSPMTTKGTKCYLYFDELASIKDTLLAYYSTVLTRTDFSTSITETTTGVIYKSADESQYDNDGEVYYFAGAPTDNWVSFAGYYWRIIRINGDGTLRLIYAGTSTTTSGTDDQIGTSTFNDLEDKSEYVGLKYTDGSQHGTNTNSTILILLNNWYKTNMEDKNYSSYLDTNTGFCNDRSMANGYIWSSEPNNTIYYKAYERLNLNKNPTFKCNNNDLFTINESKTGNKALQYPIGLITGDEAAYAGGAYEVRNTNYYLYTSQGYWTMTPIEYSQRKMSGVLSIFTSGNISGYMCSGACVHWEKGIRPVINLRADTTILRGTGTQTDPFVITE